MNSNMRKLIVAEHISLDGVVQAPGGPEEDPSGGFAFGGWTVPYASEAQGKVIRALHEQPFELLLGRRTYDIWDGYWPNAQPGNPIGDAFKCTVKHYTRHRCSILTLTVALMQAAEIRTRTAPPYAGITNCFGASASLTVRTLTWKSRAPSLSLCIDRTWENSG